MAYNIIRPRRGIKSLWDTYKSRIYKNGEMLVESPETGVGSGMVNVKFGDGVTSYENLPYAIMAPTDELTEGGKAPMSAGAGYALKKLIGESGTEDFVQGVSKSFESGETILDWAVNPNGVYKRFVITGAVPSDAPSEIEGFVELNTDESGARKTVYFREYGSNRIKEREIFQGAWRSDEWKDIADGANACTLEGLGALDFFRYLGFVSDIFEVTDTGFVSYNSETLNTPYKAGLSDAQIGLCLVNKLVSDYSTYIAFPNGDNNIYLCTKTGTWAKGATTAALSNYLPLSGGNLTDSLTIKLKDDVSKYIAYYLQSSLRRIEMGISVDGAFHLYDTTNSGDIVRSTVGGVNTFNGTATGNLPLTGGDVGGTGGSVPLHIKGNSSNESFLGFLNASSEVLGYLGFAGANNPIYGTAEARYPLFHSGNSNAVVISETPLTSSGAIRVW